MRGQFLMEPVVSFSSQPLNRKLQQQEELSMQSTLTESQSSVASLLSCTVFWARCSGENRRGPGAEEHFDKSFSTLVLFWQHSSKLSYVADKPQRHLDYLYCLFRWSTLFALGINVVQSHAHISHESIEKNRYLLRQRGLRYQQPWLRQYFSLTSRARYLMLLGIFLA